jgi:hypothetical protein
MVISTLMEKIQKDLSNMWHSETDLPDYVPGGYAGRTIPKNQVSIAIFILLTLMLAMIFWNAAANTETNPLPGGSGGANVVPAIGAMDPINRHSDEYSVHPEDVSVDNKVIIEIIFTLTWEDEANEAGRTNYPDEFSLEVTTPWGDTDETPMTKNEQGEQGMISLNFSAPGQFPDTGTNGTYIANVTMGEADDQWLVGPQGPTIGSNDTGNDWTLTVTYSYWEKATEPIPEE